MVTCVQCGEENPERARFCLRAGSRSAPRLPAGEERKVVSVLFVDLVGFTGRSERADPEDVRATLRPYHERVKPEIERFGGTVEKFIGDAVMAVFGAPVAHEDDAERAVRAGSADPRRRSRSSRAKGSSSPSRAAVTTGEAVVALGARPESGEGMVTGDVVNTAARLQSAAPVGRSSSARRRCARRQAIAFEPLDPVEAKGKAEPIAVWRALDGAQPRRRSSRQSTHTPFVGREDERPLLRETFRRAERSRPSSSSRSSASPGSARPGSSRSFGRSLDERPELIPWRQGRCLPYGEGITFWALGEIVKAEAGILESDDQHEAASKLAETVEALFADDSERDWLGARLGPLVGSGRAKAPRSGATRPSRRGAGSSRRWPRGAPCVFVFEDLHWADDALLEFVEHLARLEPAGACRCSLCTARPSCTSGARAGAAASATRRRSRSRRSRRRRPGRLLRAPRSHGASRRDAGGAPRARRAETRCTPSSSCGCSSSEETSRCSRFPRPCRRSSPPGSTPSPRAQGAAAGRVGRRPRVLGRRGRARWRVGRARTSGATCTSSRAVSWSGRSGSRRSRRRRVLVLARARPRRRLPADPAAPRAESTSRPRAGSRRSRRPPRGPGELLVYHYGEALELVRAAGEERPEIEASLVRFLLLAGDRAMGLDIPRRRPPIGARSRR